MSPLVLSFYSVCPNLSTPSLVCAGSWHSAECRITQKNCHGRSDKCLFLVLVRAEPQGAMGPLKMFRPYLFVHNILYGAEPIVLFTHKKMFGPWQFFLAPPQFDRSGDECYIEQQSTQCRPCICQYCVNKSWDSQLWKTPQTFVLVST